MKKHISDFLLSLIIFSSIFFILFPYFTKEFFDLRQKRENEENHQKLLNEELALKKIADKIYLTGKFDPSKRDDFALVPTKYDIGGYNMYLKKETLYSFQNMAEVAEQNGIELKITSATRNFDYQKDLWDKKWEGVFFVDGKDLSESVPDEQERFNKLLEYMAVPGTSRHHWGTEIDINGTNRNFYETPEGEKVYAWLVENAPSFGFCQTYTLKDSERFVGYNEEKWHWSYLPLARDLTREYKNLITNDDLTGFDGDEYVPSLNLINDYVLGINPECL